MQHPDDIAVPHSVATVEGQRAVWIAGPTCVRHEAVAEIHFQQQMQRVVAWVHGRTDAVITGWLTPEPQSGFDPHAVAIWVLGGKVGYLQRDLSIRWQPLLGRLSARHGAAVACQATLDPPSVANQGGHGIVLWLPVLPAPQPVPSQPTTSPVMAWLGGPAAGAPRSAPSQRVPTQREPVSSQPAPAPLPAPAVVDTPPPPAAMVPSPPAEPVLSPEQLAKLQADIEAARRELSSVEAKLRADVEVARRELSSVEAKHRADIEVARRELSSVEEALEIQSFGFYKPRYGFESSAQYVARLASVRDDQKRLISDDKAAPCDTTWKVGGSAAAGKKMIKQQAKLMLRAFNGECDAAIAKVKYDNAVTLEERITKAYDAINKLGEVQRVFISRPYLDLKLAELHLVHEHREKVQQEKDEQKRIREQMREEQKAQAEIDRAKAEAEKQEEQSVAALEKARTELTLIEEAGKHNDKLEGLVARLENELEEALDRKAKAIARAQLTKSGHVYVLSNIGSFGEGIYKIGMTRRLDPLERVDELGDASVPFPFDVHAIIFSEDAPGLENKLHRAFAHRRVNLVNMRKEYFRVTLAEIRVEVEKLFGLVTFLLVPEAEEYRKTAAAASAPPEEPSVVEPLLDASVAGEQQ